MAYSLAPALSVLFLLLNLSALVANSNTKIVSHDEFFAVRNSVLRSIQKYSSQHINLTMCTQLFIQDDTDDWFIPEGKPTIFASNIRSLNRPTGVLKHSSQCSVVSVVNAFNITKIWDENWLKYIPGTFFNSFHFILTPHKLLDEMWDRPFVRRLANVVACVNRGQILWHLFTPNRYNGTPGYFHVGTLQEGVLEFSSAQDILWNKWRNMNGVQLKVAVPPSMPEKQFELQAQGKLFVYAVHEVMETARYLNSTPQVFSMPTSFTKFPNGSWDGFLGNLLDDNVDITYPYFPGPEVYAAVLISKPALCSQAKFFAPLPQKAGFSLEFLTKPLDGAIWTALLLCIIASAVVVYVLKNTADTKFVHQMFIPKLLPHRLKRALSICSYFISMLIDQSLPSSVTNFLDQITGCRWLFVAWFLAATVIGCGYKSVVVSILVKPAEVFPPQTIPELIKSDFTVNVMIYEHTMKKVISWKDELRHPIKDSGYDFRGCLRTLLKGKNVCLFVHHWLYLTAPLELVDQAGNQLYLVSKDAINSIASSFYISQRNPQLKSAVDKVVNAVVEGGLSAQWMHKSYYHNFLTTLRRQQQRLPKATHTGSEVADITFMQYPMLVLIVGCLLASCCHICLHLYCWYSKSERRVFRRTQTFETDF